MTATTRKKNSATTFSGSPTVERVERRQKKEIVGEHADDGGEQRRQQAPGDGRGEHRGQKHQRDALDRDEVFEQQADAESDGDSAGAAEIGLDAERLDFGARLDRFRRNGFAVIGRYHVDADLPGLADELVHDRAMHHLEPARPVGFADDDLGDVVRRRVGDHLFGDVAARDRDRRSAEPLGEPQKIRDAVALGVGQALRPRGLDIDCRPRHLQAIRHAPGIADQPRGTRRLADADEHPLSGRPRPRNRMRPHMRQQLLVDPLGGAAQRQLAQCGQVALREEMTNRALGLLRDIDLALVQPLDQVLGREIDDLDIVGLVEHAVGHGLAHAYPRDLGNDVVQALDMLDIEGREHVDAGGDQLLDVEIALGMPAAGRVGVSELVDQYELRAALEDRVEIHLGQQVTLVVDLLPRDHFETFEQGLGLAPSMGLDDADDDIDPLAPHCLGRLQHLIGLADPGCRAEKNLQPPAAFLLRRREQRLRGRSSFALRHIPSLAHRGQSFIPRMRPFPHTAKADLAKGSACRPISPVRQGKNAF